MPKKKDIIYPYFLECCQYTKDAFWENIFENLSYGIPPYGTYISKKKLCCSYKNKQFSYDITKKDPKKMYEDIHSLLSGKVGILSQQEKCKKRLEFKQTEKDIRKSHKKWNDIRKKNMKELLIERYVLDLKTSHKLSIKQTKFLLALIIFALLFKIIFPKDIHYDNDKIHRIDGISIKNRKIVLRKKISQVVPEYSSCKPAPKKRLSDLWDKYIKQLRKVS